MAEVPTVTFPVTATPARRVLWQLAGLLSLATLASLAGGTVFAASLYGVQWEVTELIKVTQLACSYLVGGWLTWLVLRRPAPTTAPRWWRPLRGHAAGTLAVAISALAMPAAGTLGRDLGPALFGCAVAWLAVEICRSHGVWPDNGAPCTPVQQLQRWKVAQWGFIVCGVSGLLFGLLGKMLTWLDLDIVPVMRDSQMVTLGISGPVELALTIVRSVAIEDVVVVAATITLMKAVRRPTWEIYTLVCLIEIGLHAYFGLPAIGAAAMAAGRVWLYLRYRSLLPLMAAHTLWDLFPELGRLSLPYRLMAGVLLAVLFTEIDRRLKKTAGQPPPEAPASSQPTTPTHDRDRMQETRP